jgi:hypothetical protein
MSNTHRAFFIGGHAAMLVESLLTITVSESSIFWAFINAACIGWHWLHWQEA